MTSAPAARCRCRTASPSSIRSTGTWTMPRITACRFTRRATGIRPSRPISLRTGGRWPVHCVQGTVGARFPSSLHLPPATTVLSKGEQVDTPGYSAFEGRTRDGTLLLDDLRKHDITHLYVGGLATDYCVRASVLDALSAGLTVTVLQDAVAGVDVRPGDSARAIAEMRKQGASFAFGPPRTIQRALPVSV